MRKSNFVYLVLLVVCSCSQDPSDPTPPTLQFPTNNEACLEGESLNDTQKNIPFQWTQSSNAESYEITIKNLLAQTEQLYTSPANAETIALLKGTPYSWSVSAIGVAGSQPAVSETWKFYLAGDNVVNYAPFPPELITPRSGATLTPNQDGEITLSWSASDVDGDLSSFSIYLDKTNGSMKIKELAFESETMSINVQVELKATYYWKVVANDANNNSSDSGVYGFRTN